MTKYLWTVLRLLPILLLAGCMEAPPQSPAGTSERPLEAPVVSLPSTDSDFSGGSTTDPADLEGTLEVHFMDVGQGDATLLVGPDFTMLIDAARHDRNDVVPYLQAAGVESIDLLIGTHPHADHIGQIPQVLEAFSVAEVWMSGDEHTSRTFERALDAILASDADYHEPRAGEVVEIGSARVEVVHPAELTGDFNHGSVGVRVVFGNVAFMLTGDAEVEAETEMLQRGHELRAQVLKLGHHGSRTSSTETFVRAVAPEVAIYSAGIDNSYGHPHAEVLQRMAALDVPVYGTAEHGTIRVVTDGHTYTVHTERGAPIRGPPTAEPVFPVEPPPERINVNTASLEELQRIVHIGPERAEELIRHRPYTSLDQLTRIEGLGPGRIQDIKDQGLAGVE